VPNNRRRPRKACQARCETRARDEPGLRAGHAENLGEAHQGSWPVCRCWGLSRGREPVEERKRFRSRLQNRSQAGASRTPVNERGGAYWGEQAPPQQRLIGGNRTALRVKFSFDYGSV
jgi:hypothetical protein